jgi:hypothetical protein
MRIEIVPRLLSLAVVVALAPGCASVMRPYIDPPTASEVASPVSVGDSSAGRGSTVDVKPFAPIPVEDAVRFAMATQHRLHKAAHDHALSVSGAGAVLIPLASLVAYKGFAGGNSHNIAALATAGAAALGVTNYVYRPRDMVYLSGAAAVQCAIETTSPSIIADSIRVPFEEAKRDIAAQSTVLLGMPPKLDSAWKSVTSARAAVGKAVKHASDVKAGGGVMPDAAMLQETVQELDDATTSLQSQEARHKELGSRLVSAANQIAEMPQADYHARKTLIDATRRIIGEVNIQLAMDRPDPAKLAGLVPQLKLPAKAASSPTAQGGGDAAKSAVPRTNESTDLSKALAEAELSPSTMSSKFNKVLIEQSRASTAAARDAVAVVSRDVRSLVTALNAMETEIASIEAVIRRTSVTEGDVVRLVEQCGLDKSLPVPLKVSVPAGGAKLKQGEVLRLPVVGGSKPYAPVVTSSPKGTGVALEIVEGMGNSRTLVVTAPKEASVGDYLLLVQDARGRADAISLKVEAAPPN